MRSRIGVVFQHFNLFPHMRVIDNVTLAARKVHGVDPAEANRRGPGAAGLTGAGREGGDPDRLSGGQQQRVAIVRAILTEPAEQLLLDEITSALDPQLVGEVLDLVRELREERGSTILMATHEMSFAREVADRIVFMRGGVIIEQGTPEQIFDAPQRRETAEFLARVR